MKIKILLPLLFCFLFSSVSYSNIKVGTLFFDPPFVLSLGEGFDIDLTHLLCKGLNEQCTIIPMDFNKLYTALDDGTIDIAIGGISISPHREQHYIFTLPYMLCKRQFMILKSSTITSVNDLTGTTVGVIEGDPQGGVSYHYLLDTYGGKFKITQFNDMEDLVTALSNNQISAAFLHRSSVVYWVENGGGQFKEMGDVLTLGDGIGIMSLPKNQALIQRINQLLETMEKDNVYLSLYKTYFSQE